MALQSKRALVIALLMATSLSQGGYTMQDVDKISVEKRVNLSVEKRVNLSLFTIAKTFFIFGALACQAEGISPFPREDYRVTPDLGIPFRLNERSVSSIGATKIAVAGLKKGNNVAGVWASTDLVTSRVVSPEGANFRELNVSENTSSPGSKFPSAIACDNYFGVTWRDELERGTEAILGRVLFKNGTAATPPFIVDQNEKDSPKDPTVGCLSNGDFSFVWRRAPYGSDEDEISGRIFSRAGTAVTGKFSIKTVTGRELSAPFALGLRDSGFFVSFYSGSPAFKITGQFFENNGNPRGEELIIHSATRPLAPPRADQFPNGDIVVVCKEDDHLIGHIIRNGVPGNGFLIASAVGEFGIAALQGNLALVAYGGSKEGDGIAGQFLLSDGTPMGSFKISTAGEVPSVTSLASKWFVAWAEKRTGSSEIYGRRVSLQLPQ